MHKSTKLTPKMRGEIYREWCRSRPSFRSLGLKYHVDKNVVRKVVSLGRLGDFSVHDSANRRYRTIEYGLRRLARTEARIAARQARRHGFWKDRTEPGELVHFDTKRLPYAEGEKRGFGLTAREALFVAVDDASRWLTADVLPDKTGDSAALFLETCVRRQPFLMGTHYSDNAPEFKGNPTHPLLAMCAQLGIDRRYTLPRHPWTNGKAERVIRTLMEEWMSGTRHMTREERRKSLYEYVDHYNHERAHRSLKGKTPEESVHSLLESGDNA